MSVTVRRPPPQDDPKAMAAYFAELSHDLLSAADEPVTFDRVVRRAVEVVPGCDHAGIAVRRRRGRAEVVAATDPAVRECDEMQYTLADGPTLDEAFEHQNCVVHDLRVETRWLDWAPRAAALGMRSLLAVRLHTDGQTLGALSLYSEQPGAFSGETIDVALIFAAHATEALSKARLVTGLTAAIESRHMIGIAQGVLVQRYDVTPETAFEVLRRHSNDNNLKLRDVAQMVLVQRGLPAPGPAPARS